MERIIIDFLSRGRNICDTRFGNYVTEGIREVEETASVSYGHLFAMLNRQIL